MEIMASDWMRRLWTLQEAFLSKRLWIPFEQATISGSGGMKDFDKLLGSMTGTNTLTSSFAEMARLKLLRNIMGEERLDRRARNGRQDSRQTSGAILIANAWRAARWRVSASDFESKLHLTSLD